MAVNKNKILASAQRFVEKGQIGKAIKEYVKLVELDKGDIRSHLKLGELYSKNNEISTLGLYIQYISLACCHPCNL